MGTGCARGFLAAFDTAWMVNSWAQGRTVLDVLAERYYNRGLRVYVLFKLQFLLQFVQPTLSILPV